MFAGEWVEVCGDSSEGQKTINALVRVTTMAHDDESPAGQMTFTQNSTGAHHRRSLFGYKVRPEVVPWPEEHRVTIGHPWYSAGATMMTEVNGNLPSSLRQQ